MGKHHPRPLFHCLTPPPTFKYPLLHPLLQQYMVRMSGRLQQSLEIKIPSSFQCPISLELMRSPVSLCTGVSYDRSSIQSWLDSGHTTCPATMLPLHSTDLVPNLTLRRLIHHWCSAHPDDLLASLNSPDPVPTILKIADLLRDPKLDDSVKNNLASSCSSIIVFNISTKSDTQVVEAAVRVIALIFTKDCIEESIKVMTSAALISNIQQSLSPIMTVMSKGSTLDSRADAATVFDVLIPDSRNMVADTPGLVSEVIGLINNGGEAAKAGIACLIRVSEAGRRVIIQLVRAGLVPAIMRVLASEEPAKGAIRLLEVAMECAEGRVAICEVAEACATAVVGRMMKVGRVDQESAVAVLWGLCCVARDSRARSAVAGASGGLAKILLLMQRDCSPSARRMSGDLLRIFRLDRKSCLAGYDTKTTHIMPF